MVFVVASIEGVDTADAFRPFHLKEARTCRASGNYFDGDVIF